MDERTRRARDFQRAIGEALLRDWDPLGVADEPECADEYDAYVGPVYRLLATGASDREIAEDLASVEAESLGYPDTGWRTLLPVAHKLRNLYARLAVDAPAS
jgi:hypothetical protein